MHKALHKSLYRIPDPLPGTSQLTEAHLAYSQPHLERRKTGFYWRRRVPARPSNRFIPAFFCFPLRTHVPREAAKLARRLTTISELCFNAKTIVHPELMISIIVEYSRFEIEGFDHLRALTGPRTRQAAEAALEIEAIARASLRDAIFLCDHARALSPIRDTARRLGLEIGVSSSFLSFCCGLRTENGFTTEGEK